MRKGHGRAKVGRAVRVRAQELHHGVPRVVTGAAAARGGVVDEPRLRGVGALEEAVVAGAVVAIGRGEDAARRFRPGRRRRRTGAAVPRQEAQAVRRRPAVRRRVGNVRLAAVVQGGGPLVDGVRDRLPGFRGLRNGVDAARDGDVVGAQLLQADGLVRVAVEARAHEEVAVAGRPQDRGVNGPLARQLGRVGEAVVGGGAAWILYMISIKEYCKQKEIQKQEKPIVTHP